MAWPVMVHFSNFVRSFLLTGGFLTSFAFPLNLPGILCRARELYFTPSIEI